jgi:hypothetical protein
LDTKDVVTLLEGLRLPRKDPNLSNDEISAVRGAILRLRDFELLRTICLLGAKWSKAHPALPGEPAEDRELRKALDEFKALKSVENFKNLTR